MWHKIEFFLKEKTVLQNDRIEETEFGKSDAWDLSNICDLNEGKTSISIPPPHQKDLAFFDIAGNVKSWKSCNASCNVCHVVLWLRF